MPRPGRPKLTDEERRAAQAITTRLFDRIGTQRELADELGITGQAVSKWTKGAAGWLRLARVCEAARVSADDILGLRPPMGLSVERAAEVRAKLGEAQQLLADVADPADPVEQVLARIRPLLAGLETPDQLAEAESLFRDVLARRKRNSRGREDD